MVYHWILPVPRTTLECTNNQGKFNRNVEPPWWCPRALVLSKNHLKRQSQDLPTKGNSQREAAISAPMRHCRCFYLKGKQRWKWNISLVCYSMGESCLCIILVCHFFFIFSFLFYKYIAHSPSLFLHHHYHYYYYYLYL